MDRKRLLGEASSYAELAAWTVGALLVLHVVTGRRWREAHTMLGFAATGLYLTSQL